MSPDIPPVFLLVGLLGGLAIVKAWSNFYPKEQDERRRALAEELKTRLAWLSASVLFLAMAGFVLMFPHGLSIPEDLTIYVGYGLGNFVAFVMASITSAVMLWFAVDLKRIRAWEVRNSR